MISEINSEEMFSIDLNESNKEFHFQRTTIMTWNESDGEDDDTAINFQGKETFISIIIFFLNEFFIKIFIHKLHRKFFLLQLL